MQVYVNGEQKQVSDNSSLAELIEQLELPATRVAVELNRAVVRRSNWETTILSDGDRLEIVHFVGGGAANTPARLSYPPLEQQLRNSRSSVLNVNKCGRFT